MGPFLPVSRNAADLGLLVVAKNRAARRAPKDLAVAAELYDACGAHDGRIIDISATGLLVETNAMKRVGQRVGIVFARNAVVGRVVRLDPSRF